MLVWVVVVREKVVAMGRGVGVGCVCGVDCCEVLVWVVFVGQTVVWAVRCWCGLCLWGRLLYGL